MEPYTPKASGPTPGSKEVVSASGLSRSIVVPGQRQTPVKSRTAAAVSRNSSRDKNTVNNAASKSVANNSRPVNNNNNANNSKPVLKKSKSKPLSEDEMLKVESEFYWIHLVS